MTKTRAVAYLNDFVVNLSIYLHNLTKLYEVYVILSHRELHTSFTVLCFKALCVLV